MSVFNTNITTILGDIYNCLGNILSSTWADITRKCQGTGNEWANSVDLIDRGIAGKGDTSVITFIAKTIDSLCN